MTRPCSRCQVRDWIELTTNALPRRVSLNSSVLGYIYNMRGDDEKWYAMSDRTWYIMIQVRIKWESNENQNENTSRTMMLVLSCTALIGSSAWAVLLALCARFCFWRGHIGSRGAQVVAICLIEYRDQRRVKEKGKENSKENEKNIKELEKDWLWKFRSSSKFSRDCYCSQA